MKVYILHMHIFNGSSDRKGRHLYKCFISKEKADAWLTEINNEPSSIACYEVHGVTECEVEGAEEYEKTFRSLD